ncbi:MAG TPA: DeoR/GlpR family DNA-binding transcription regulator [Rhodoblastus sp.]|nr:DeoR/GlpR family DNA-binding transcription regulator [Rhodoblastus sp.]
MLTAQRKTLILARLKADGQVVATELARETGLSEDTIRRDLRELAAEGLLQRVHGGALLSSPAVADFSRRQTIAATGKVAIGRAAAAMVRPGQFVFLDGGAATAQIARSLSPDLKATIVTHSPSIAVELVDHPNVTVELIGGRLFKHSVVSVGVAALEAIRKIRPDVYFMGVTGIHEDYGLTTGDPEEAAIKRAICELAAETVVLASNEKLGAVSPCLIAPLAEIDSVLAEGQLPPRLETRLQELNIGVIRV